MTQLTFFGSEAAPFILSLAYQLAVQEHRVMVLRVEPDHGASPVDAAHLTGIRLGDLHVRPEHVEQTVQAVSSAGFGHALVIWSGPARPPRLQLTTKHVETARLTLQELAVTLARLAGTGPLGLTVTDMPSLH